ncbi:MAG TPA: ABC transporter ATP-binding protein [Candidatus Binatia bacterium]|nr:ABC transporter ATP-binding protein [Candidatus Binatia bacterium]
MATVSLHGLTKKFTGMAAVDDLHLEIKDGEFVSLLGPSGCGKTTTLRLVAGFLQPDAGEIRVNDNIISSASTLIPPERRNMSMIFQSYAIWPHMTVFQNVAYGLKFKKLAGREIDEKTERLLRIVHLEALKARYPAELSGGQQQRVALARALVVEPQILLLDEPLSNLDANLREEMRFEIRRLHEEFRITTIYVTHDQAEAMVTSDRIVVLNKGRMVQVGTPSEIFDQPRTRFVAEFIGKTNILAGRLEGRNVVILGPDLRITIANGSSSSPADEVRICIRPHNIALTADESEARAMASRGFNLFSGVLERRIYFGDAVDYTVALALPPASLRVISPPSRQFDKGQRVFALAHPDQCVLVRDD